MLIASLQVCPCCTAQHPARGQSKGSVGSALCLATAPCITQKAKPPPHGIAQEPAALPRFLHKTGMLNVQNEEELLSETVGNHS